MEVVIALAKRDKSSDDVVTRRVTVVKWLIAEPMSQRVDAESGLLHEEDSEDASIDEPAEPVTPAEAANECGKDEAHEDDNLQVVLVLPDNDRVLVEIRNIGSSNSLWVLLHQHPSKMRVQKTLADRVRIFLGICVSVMSTMITSPPPHRAFDSSTTGSSEEHSKRKGSRI